MNIKTNTNKRCMKYEHYIYQPMQAVEIKLNEIIARNRHLIQSLDRTSINPLIRKCSLIPLKKDRKKNEKIAICPICLESLTTNLYFASDGYLYHKNCFTKLNFKNRLPR